jgi:membrane protein DedA with SNARE-associated domain
VGRTPRASRGLRGAGYQYPKPRPDIPARSVAEAPSLPRTPERPARLLSFPIVGPPEAPRAPGPTEPNPLETPLLALFTDFVTGEIARWGYLAIFLLMVLESACIPIPSEVTMLFGGALVTAPFLAPEQQLEFWLVVLAGTLGNLVGSWLAYWAGYSGGRPLIDRWGRYLLIRPHEVDRAHEWFEHRGQAAVFVGRLLPVIRTFISLPAGVVRMGFWRFTVYTFLGCLPWVLLLTWIGTLLGERWDEAERVIRPFAWAIAGLLVLGLAVFVWRRIRTIRLEEAARASRSAPMEADASPERPPERVDES